MSQLKNSYQVTIMSESENINLNEESQENQSVMHPENPSDFDASSSEDLHDREEISAESDDSSKKEDKSKRKEGSDVQLDAFVKSFEQESELDRKLQLAIDFMEGSLAQGGTPQFRHFWEARRLCLPLFKENISPALRSQLWARYSELSKEARRLKEILDEQSAFAVEQIDIAIKALETDINDFNEQIEKTSLSEEIQFPQALGKKVSHYQELQKQLNLLNVQASRINALRKELLKTEMRIRQKNKFFQRLSLAGDKVFPRRKDLIKEISQLFVDDVNQFIKKHFQDELEQESLYVLREEIKLFQGLAKVLTLNTNAFTQTRMHLSECWDRLKIAEKERKKERAQLRTAFKQNAEVVQEKIEALKVEINQGLSTNDTYSKMEDISRFMRQVDLGRDEIKSLRDQLHEIRQSLQAKVRAEEEERQQQEQERNRQKRERYKVLRDQAEQLINQHESYDADKLAAERDVLISQANDVSFTKSEKQEIERILKPLRDIISDKKEKRLLSLSEDDRQSLQQLKDILKQRKERRQEIKTQLESYRKAAGSSGLDFEKAMAYANQINEENERLEKINQGIKEIEDKIAQLQSKIQS